MLPRGCQEAHWAHRPPENKNKNFYCNRDARALVSRIVKPDMMCICNLRQAENAS